MRIHISGTLSLSRISLKDRNTEPNTKPGSLARAGREFGPERENQNNGVGAGFQRWTKYSNPEMQPKPGKLGLHRVCGMRTLLSFPIQQPRTSDSSPHDFETWRVQLPSRPEEERVARLVAHENASRDFASDLALLQLRTRVNLTAAPSAVCLPHREHYFLPGSRCRLARWGRGGARGRAGPRTGWGGRSGKHAAEATPWSLFLSELAPGSGAQLEAQLLNSWWCHCLYGRQGESVPPPGDPPHLLCPAYQEEEEAGLCWVSGRNSLRKSGPDLTQLEAGGARMGRGVLGSAWCQTIISILPSNP